MRIGGMKKNHECIGYKCDFKKPLGPIAFDRNKKKTAEILSLKQRSGTSHI